MPHPFAVFAKGWERRGQSLPWEGYESAVYRRRTVEPDDHAAVVDAVHDGRANAVRIVDGRESATAGPHESVRIAARVDVVTHYLSLVIQPQSLGEGATRDIKRHQQAEVQQEAVVHAVSVDVEPANFAASC